MDLAERFMGRREAMIETGELVANPVIDRGPSYQILLMGRLDLDPEGLTTALRSFHPSLARARVELTPVALENAAAGEEGSLLGLAGWGDHVVKILGFNTPIPEKVYDACVRPAHFSQQLKDDGRAHQSHLLLYYAGYHPDPLENYVAMTIVAAAFARFDGFLLLNENARSAFPAEALLVQEPDVDSIDMLRAMPIPLLYGGFVKIEIEEEPGVWMRTFGNRLLNLPDFSFKAIGHHQGSETFDLFANMLSYLRDSGASFAPGHTMQVGEETQLKLRAPTTEEWYLESDGEMLVVESV